MVAISFNYLFLIHSFVHIFHIFLHYYHFLILLFFELDFTLTFQAYYNRLIQFTGIYCAGAWDVPAWQTSLFCR